MFSERIHHLSDPRLVCKFRKIWLTENRQSRALFTSQKQNFGSLSRSRFCTDRAQNLSGPAPDNILEVSQISSESVHFRRSYSRTREHRWNAPQSFFPILGEASSPSKDKCSIGRWRSSLWPPSIYGSIIFRSCGFFLLFFIFRRQFSAVLPRMMASVQI